MVKIAKAAGGDGYSLKLGLNLTAVGTGEMSDQQIEQLPLPDEIEVTIKNVATGEVLFRGTKAAGRSARKQGRNGPTGGNINYSIQERL
jgi:hypothetical protein